MTPSESDLPVVEPPTDADGNPAPPADPVREGRVAGVLLAAGTSSRFGEANKLLATVDGDPLVRHAARSLAAADVDSPVAVVGHGADRIERALDGLGFSVVYNPDYEQGQATSVRVAINALDDVTAAVFALGDMPCIRPQTTTALVAAYRAGRGTALAAAHEGERGNPVLFDSYYFDALADVEGDVGGRHILLSGEDSALVETGDPGVTRDVDTSADLDDLRR